MASEVGKSGLSVVSCEDFDGLVMDYVYDERLSNTERAGVEAHEKQCEECAELAKSLREAHIMSGVLMDIEPPVVLNQKIINLARARNAQRFPRIIEPLGWLAAASFLLSCGYILGFVTAKPATTTLNGSETALATRGGGSSNTIATDLAAAPLQMSKNLVSISFNPEQPQSYPNGPCPTLELVGNFQCLRLQAEHCADQESKDELLLAWYTLRRIRKLIDAGQERDGPYAIDDVYRAKVSELETKIRKRARQQGIKLVSTKR